MANVEFERGIEDNLPTSGMAEDGHIYVSSDNGNAYLGDSNGNLIPINRSPYFATCSTSGSTAAKVATIVDTDNFELRVGTVVNVAFSAENDADSPTLSVNGSTAAYITASHFNWYAGETIPFVWNGDEWIEIGHGLYPDWAEDDETKSGYIYCRPAIREGFGINSIIENAFDKNAAYGDYSHAEGMNTVTIGETAHAEGLVDLSYEETIHLTTFGKNSYSIGDGESVDVGDVLRAGDLIAMVTSISKSTVFLDNSLGDLNDDQVYVVQSRAEGHASHVEGINTIALNDGEHAEGILNISRVGQNADLTTISTIGIGGASPSVRRKNAVEVRMNGDVYINGIGDFTGTLSQTGTPLPIQTVIGGLETNVSDLWDGKADIVEDAVDGNFAGLDSDGNLTDSGYAPSDFITQHQTLPVYTLEDMATPTTGYLKSYRLLKDGSAINGSAVINIPKDFLVKSGSVIDVVEYNGNYYDATDTSHTNPLSVSAAGKYLDFVVNTADNSGTDTHIYILVSDLVDVYTAGNGIEIGSGNSISVKIDSSDANGLSVGSGGLALAPATAPVSGSGGSYGAMSPTDKEKLDGIASGAEANVQSDWNQTDSTADDYIKNKPTVVDSRYHDSDSITIKELIPLQDYTILESAANAASTRYDLMNIYNEDTEFEMRLRSDSITRSNFFGTGGYSGYANTYGFVAISGTQTKFVFGLGGGSSATNTSLVSNITRVAGHIYTVKGYLKKGNATLFVKDETTGDQETLTASYVVSGQYYLRLFDYYYNGSHYYLSSGTHFYNIVLRCYGSTVYNLIPVKRKSDNAVGFYNTVSQTFMLPTSGSLVADAELPNINDYRMELNNVIAQDRRFTGNVTLDQTEVIHKALLFKWGSQYANIAKEVFQAYYSSSSTEQIIKTKVRFSNDFVGFHIYGYMYNPSDYRGPFDLTIATYIYPNTSAAAYYTNSFISRGVWSPYVYLFKYTNETDNLDYIAIGLKSNSAVSYYSLHIDCWKTTTSLPISSTEGWVVSMNSSDTSQSIIPEVGTDKCVSVSRYTISTNVTSASKLATARNVQTNLASTSSASFDGSANITPGVSGVLGTANGGTGNNGVDTTPTANSTKMVTSGGIKTALDDKADDTSVVHKSGAETISGKKTFSRGFVLLGNPGNEISVASVAAEENNGVVEFVDTDESADVVLRGVSYPYNNNDAANKAYVDESIPSAATSTPLMDGTASVGSSTAYAKEDHVHPSDSSKQDKLIAGHDIELAHDVIEVEYLQSSGTQYIDTMFVPNQDSRLVMDVLVPTLSTSACTFGGSANSAWTPGFSVYGGNTTYQMASVYNNSDVTASTSYKFTANNRYTLDLNKNVYNVYKDGTLQYTYTHTAGDFTLSKAIELFRINIPTPRYGKFRLYSAKIYDNGTLVRDFIPTKYNSVGYLYDKVNGVLYGNAGTGSFTVGEEVYPCAYHINFVNDDGFVADTDMRFWNGKEIVSELGTTYPLRNHYINNSRVWASSTTNKHYVVPINGIRKVEITTKSGVVAIYSFFKSYTFNDNDTPTSEYATDYDGCRFVYVDGTMEIKVPYDAEWLYLYAGSSNGSTPSSVKLIGISIASEFDGDGDYSIDFMTADDAIVANYRDHDATSRLLEKRHEHYRINTTNLKWLYQTGYGCSMVELSPNLASVKIRASNSSNAIVAFLYNQGIVEAGDPYFCENTSLVTITAGNTQTLTIPSDAKYLYVYIGILSNGAYSAIPQGLWLTGKRGVENFPLKINGTTYDGSQPVTMTIQGGGSGTASSIPFGQVDSSSTSTVFTATVNGITELADGVCMYLRNGVVNSSSGFTININNLGAKPVYQNIADNTRVESGFQKAKTFLFVYNSSRVTGGCWDIYYGISSVTQDTNSIGYQLRTNSSTLPAKFKTYSYRLLFTSADGNYWVAANASSSTNGTDSRTPTTEKINPFGDIVYYGNTTVVNANTSFGATYLWQQYTLTLGYSFNNTGSALVLQYPKPVYIKCTPQLDGSAIIDSTTPYVQALPNSEDGSIYIFLGVAYSATAVELKMNHPVYCYSGGAIRQWTAASIDDTNLVHKTGAETISGTKTFNGGIEIGGSVLNFAARNGNENEISFSNNTVETVGNDPIGVLAFSDADSGLDVILRGLHAPVGNTDAATKKYVDDIVGDIETLLAAI